MLSRTAKGTHPIPARARSCTPNHSWQKRALLWPGQRKQCRGQGDAGALGVWGAAGPWNGERLLQRKAQRPRAPRTEAGGAETGMGARAQRARHVVLGGRGKREGGRSGLHSEEP